MIFLGEALNISKLIGTILIFSAVIIVTKVNTKSLGKLKNKGVQYTLLTAVIYSIAFIAGKAALEYFTPGYYLFLIYLIPTIALTPLLLDKKKELRFMITNLSKPILLTGVITVIQLYLTLLALQLADASLVYPILRLSLLSSLGLGYFWLKERKDMKRKIAGSAAAIIGALFITGYFSI